MHHASFAARSNSMNEFSFYDNQIVSTVGMMSDGMSDPSSPESTFDTSDIIMSDAITDDVTTQLAASGMYNGLSVSSRKSAIELYCFYQMQ